MGSREGYLIPITVVNFYFEFISQQRTLENLSTLSFYFVLVIWVALKLSI